MGAKKIRKRSSIVDRLIFFNKLNPMDQFVKVIEKYLLAGTKKKKRVLRRSIHWKWKKNRVCKLLMHSILYCNNSQRFSAFSSWRCSHTFLYIHEFHPLVKKRKKEVFFENRFKMLLHNEKFAYCNYLYCKILFEVIFRNEEAFSTVFFCTFSHSRLICSTKSNIIMANISRFELQERRAILCNSDWADEENRWNGSGGIRFLYNNSTTISFSHFPTNCIFFSLLRWLVFSSSSICCSYASLFRNSMWMCHVDLDGLKSNRAVSR